MNRGQTRGELMKLLSEQGFSDITKKDLNEIIDCVITNTGAAGQIMKERERQIVEEGYPVKDDVNFNSHGELARAAMCYMSTVTHNTVPSLWPYHKNAWKPGSRLRDLVKAGALVAAEIDRMEDELCQ